MYIDKLHSTIILLTKWQSIYALDIPDFITFCNYPRIDTTDICRYNYKLNLGNVRKIPIFVTRLYGEKESLWLDLRRHCI